MKQGTFFTLLLLVIICIVEIISISQERNKVEKDHLVAHAICQTHGHVLVYAYDVYGDLRYVECNDDYTQTIQK